MSAYSSIFRPRLRLQIVVITFFSIYFHCVQSVNSVYVHVAGENDRKLFFPRSHDATCELKPACKGIASQSEIFGERLKSLNTHSASCVDYANLLRLRGGISTLRSIFDSIEESGKQVFGTGLWAFLKNMVGLGSTRMQNSPEQDLKELQHQMNMTREMRNNSYPDRQFLYFLSQGPTFFLNPMVYLLRYVRGTEKTMREAIVFLHSNAVSRLDD